MSIPTSPQFYGDQTRWFIGTVLSINDPLKLGRVQVRIYGVHTGNETDIPLSDLPWAQVVIPVTEGGSSGIGANVGIKNQAQVYGIFLDGVHSQLPMVLGSIPKIEGIPFAVDTDDTEKYQGAIPGEELGELQGSSNIERAYNYFLSIGYTAEQSAGILGNLIQESKIAGNDGALSVRDKTGAVIDIYPGATNKTNGAFGIAQWNPKNPFEDRKAQLIKFTEENNTRFKFPYTYDTLLAQLNFIKFELNTKTYLGNAELQQATSVAEATEIFDSKYEISGGLELDDRVFFAEAVFDVMNRDDA